MTVTNTYNYNDAPYLEIPYLESATAGFDGFQAQIFNTKSSSYGFQSLLKITRTASFGFQSLLQITKTAFFAFQSRVITIKYFGFQATAAIYNVTNLRILSNFTSRGLSTGAGNNAWGNPIATGATWNASSTQAGQFFSSNLNTDVVEQYWRSATGITAGVTLDCDTEVTQGVIVDTIAILGTNLTTSASITVAGANDAGFSSILFLTTLTVLKNDQDIYYITPELPQENIRYFRFDISDPGNPDGFLRVGTIVFGQSDILHGECFVDELEFELQDFSDTVRTEGFTNVANSKSQKKLLKLDFQSLQLEKRNFKLLRRLFLKQRTILKSVWIPTPDITDQARMQQFSLFGKMNKVPTETHKSVSKDTNYVSFNIEVDESK